MEDKKSRKITTKTIKFDEELLKEIEKLADENERDFSSQVRFMLRKYLQIKKEN